MKSKSRLRAEKLNELKDFSLLVNEKMRIERQITQKLISSSEWKNARTIALYASMRHEFDTKQLFEQALNDGKRVAFPKTFPNRRLAFFEVDRNTKFEKTSFGVYEPISNVEISHDAIDLMLVPGVAFQIDGYRIGYGGGFYDKYLKDFSGYSISLAFPCQMISDVPIFDKSFDQPVQMILILDESRE